MHPIACERAALLGKEKANVVYCVTTVHTINASCINEHTGIFLMFARSCDCEVRGQRAETRADPIFNLAVSTDKIMRESERLRALSAERHHAQRCRARRDQIREQSESESSSESRE